MRSLRPYNGRTCYFHGRIAYVAFASEKDMLDACNGRILHNDYLLNGRPHQLSHPYMLPATVASSPDPRNHQTSYNNYNNNNTLHQQSMDIENNILSSDVNTSTPLHLNASHQNSTKHNTITEDPLAVILGKLNELDSIKEHLARLDVQFSSFANNVGPMAHRL